MSGPLQSQVSSPLHQWEFHFQFPEETVNEEVQLLKLICIVHPEYKVHKIVRDNGSFYKYDKPVYRIQSVFGRDQRSAKVSYA